MNGKVIRCAVAVLLAGEAVSGQTARQSDYVLTGKVTMADGSPIPKPAAIERYCTKGTGDEGRGTDCFYTPTEFLATPYLILYT